MARPPADAPLLNHDLILKRAVDAFRNPGSGGISWRGLAEELKVKPSALYHYYPSKETLEQAAYSSVLSQLPLPQPGQQPWQEQLHALAHDFHTLYAEYPGIAAHLLGNTEPLAAEYAIGEVLAVILRGAGIPDADLIIVTRNLILFFASSFTLEMERPEVAVRRYALNQQHALQFPLLASLPMPTNSQRNFEVITRMLIAGIEALV